MLRDRKISLRISAESQKSIDLAAEEMRQSLIDSFQRRMHEAKRQLMEHQSADVNVADSIKYVDDFFCVFSNKLELERNQFEATQEALRVDLSESIIDSLISAEESKG